MIAPQRWTGSALIACRDSRAELEAEARRCGADPSQFLILSRRDNPELRTFEDILAALPPSVRVIGLDDAEYLLPEGQRDTATVRAFLLDLKRRYGHRFQVFATSTPPLCAGHVLYHEVL